MSNHETGELPSRMVPPAPPCLAYFDDGNEEYSEPTPKPDAEQKPTLGQFIVAMAVVGFILACYIFEWFPHLG